MKILHPNKENYLPLSELEAYYSEDVYKIIGKNKEKKLDFFLSSFKDYRKLQDLKSVDKLLYKSLPFSMHTDVWKERQKDAKIIYKTISDKQNLSILDIGSWNGWLSNHLSKKGHHVVAVNIFIDEIDGLRACKHYETKFVSLQLFTDEIFRIKHQFDVIVFNRNWPYLPNHEKIFYDAKNLLTKDGVIMFTGLPFYSDVTTIKEKLKSADDNFKNNYGTSLYYYSAKGYLDHSDILFLKTHEIQLKSYHPLKNLFKAFFPRQVKLYYGIYKN